jgi:hypothetical protein
MKRTDELRGKALIPSPQMEHMNRQFLEEARLFYSNNDYLFMISETIEVDTGGSR